MPDAPVPPPAPPRAWWRWIQWLALDAVAVAVAWLYVFAGMTGARVTSAALPGLEFAGRMPIEAIALGIVVWLLYMTDRLLDAGTGYGRAERHHFAGKHMRWLLPVMFFAGTGILWVALHAMRWVTVKAAFAVGVGVVFYFSMVMLSRWKAVSQLLLLGISGLLMMGLLQGDNTTQSGVQTWRILVVGTMVAVLYTGLRQQYEPPPWLLIKKWVGGYLFALGVAVVPFSHLEHWPSLLHGTPVMLFAATCACNSLGIRLWEHDVTGDPEVILLRRIYPWLLLVVGGGAVAHSLRADEWSRPVLWGLVGCLAGFAVLHFWRKGPAPVRALLADAVMVLTALLVRFIGMRGLP